MLSYSSSRVLPPKYIHPHIYTHSLLQLRLYKAAHNYLQYTLFLQFCQYALQAPTKKKSCTTSAVLRAHAMKKVSQRQAHCKSTQKKRFHNAYRIVKPLYHTICSYVSHLSQCLPPTFSIHHNKYLYTDYNLVYLHSTISEISAPCRFSRKLSNPLVQICIS